MHKPVFALVDCDSCYCSIEVIFKPWLRDLPVVVLAGNDSNIVARNRPAKALGIKMAQPWFEVKHLHERGQLIVFSSNFALYNDVSNRVASLLANCASSLEQFSIDEWFLSATGMQQNLTEWGAGIQQMVLKHVGMPVGVGIAHSKTASKLANWAAKKWPAQTGGVVDMRDAAKLEKLLRYAPVEEVWGVGRKLTARLKAELGIETAWQLATADLKLLRRLFSVNMERTARELLGESCFGLDESPVPKQMIACTRSFGGRVQELSALEDAVATHASRAAAKLRSQASFTHCLQVFISTSPFGTGQKYRASRAIAFPYPTSDSRDLAAAAVEGVRYMFKPGYDYAKSGVILSQFAKAGEFTPDLFAEPTRHSSDAVMGVFDSINRKIGTGTIRLGRQKTDPRFSMRQNFMSQRYTTNWDELPIVRA